MFYGPYTAVRYNFTVSYKKGKHGGTTQLSEKLGVKHGAALA